MDNNNTNTKAISGSIVVIVLSIDRWIDRFGLKSQDPTSDEKRRCSMFDQTQPRLLQSRHQSRTTKKKRRFTFTIRYNWYVHTYGSLDEFMPFVTKAPPPSSNPERIYMALEPQYIWHPIDPFGLCHERNSHSVCPFASNKL